MYANGRFWEAKVRGPWVLYGTLTRTPVLGVRDSSLETQENVHFTRTNSPSETSHIYGFPTPKMALIRGKRTLLFSDNRIASPVLLSRAESELKMAANSTYREAKLRGVG
jgi:hypothetical protein